MNWSTYNQSLVRRGEILLGFDVINNWDTELKQMNKKIKQESHFIILILFFFSQRICQGILFHLPYRQTEGIALGHAKGKVPSIPDFTTINRRINKLNIPIKEDNKSNNKDFEDDYLVIAIDSTGIKVTNRGQWMRDKWNVRDNNKKGYLKIHIAAVNIKRVRKFFQ